MDMVVGLFNHYDNAEWALEVLKHYVNNERISVVALDKDAIEPRLAAGADSATSTPAANLSSVLKGPSGFAYDLSGMGPVLAIGSLAVKLFTSLGSIIAADAGGLLGALVDSGFSMEEAEIYAESVKQGGILVFVETSIQDEVGIKAILHGAGAVYMNNRRQISQSEGWRSTADEIREAYEATYQR